MIIENPDVFKSWLTSILEPLCDADPAALAKYVYALVKKEKPLDELRDGMLDQLDVFLQQETKPFVDMLFKALETHEYLKGVDKLPTPPPQDSPGAEPSPVDAQDTPVPAPPVGNDEGLQRAAVRHRVVLSRQGGKRQPPHEQTLVKVLPLTELLEEPVDQPPRRRDRREILREKDDRRRRRSRSWERRVRARRHARDDASEIRRPGSRSPSPRGRYRNRSPPSDRPASRSKSRSPVRDRDHERERDRLRIPREMERDRMSRDREHRERISRSRDRDRSRDRSLSPHEPRLDRDRADAYKRRCRDFDEKGYCMRGDQCQWDHGADPVVLEDAALTRALVVPPVPEYNPLAPDIWCGARFPYAPPRHVAPPRELVPIPRIRHEVPPMMGTMLPPPAPMQPRHPPPMKKNFEYNRIGPIRHPLPPNAAICSLEVKKVPRGLNDITHLNNHFSKFGKIVNIQVCFEGDQEAALITFSNPTEANVAYKSTEAVLNNRFIKVFWHNPENKQENMPPSNQQVKKPEREASQHPMSQNKVLINKDAVKATADSKKLMADKAKELTNGQEAKKDPPPAPAPAAADKSTRLVSMHKRAQELLETQLSQQRLLIEKLESGNVTGPQKTALLEAVNSAQEGIEKLRKELVALRQMQTNAKKPKTKEEAHKEILDAELDLFTKQQEGQDVTELAKKLAEMKRQMAVQFPTHPAMRRPHSRGGRFNSATRFTRLPAAVVPKAFSVNQTVDHRPRALLISGFEADELEPLVVHFSQFGEVTGKEVNLSVPELVLQYRLRAQAEVAAVKGRHYNDRTLSITWANPKQVAGLGSTPAPTTNDAVSEDNKHETPTEVTADALLRFDEEEDDDNEEDRSWRR